MNENLHITIGGKRRRYGVHGSAVLVVRSMHLVHTVAKYYSQWVFEHIYRLAGNERIRPGRVSASLLSGIMLMLLPAAGVGQQVFYSGANVTGVLSLARVVNLRQPPTQLSLFA